MNTIIYILIGVLATAAIAWYCRHQRSLKVRAHLMQEAIRNRDFTFRLPTRGLPPGECAMQQTLNALGTTIQQQVNQSEVESWERLTRVLTHEIMNATAPIASISQSLLGRNDVAGTPIEEGIRAIHNTSRHLNAFIDSYRKLSQLQEPTPETVAVAAAVGDTAQLFPQMAWHTDVPAGTTLHTDAAMLRQTLTNMAKNALEAQARNMGIGYEHSGGEHRLYVSNDGQPIPAEARSSIFIPFFTTKRTGNGIGLSLSRRMLTRLGGGLCLLERPRQGYHTTFLITLPDGN